MEPVIFRRWSNRKWAVLSSFHKIMLIGTLPFSYNLLGQAGISQEPDSSRIRLHMDLDEVETTAELPADLEHISLKPLLLVTADEISSSPAAAYGDLLDYLPQVDIRHRGRHGTQADLTIQGGSFDQSMVLLNGINLSDPQTGHFQLNLPVDLSAISQIEVVTGSAARRFGTNAFSGAINVRTQHGDSTWFRSGLRYGQHNFYKAYLVSNISGRYISTLASASTAGSDGYRSNTDFRSTHAFIHSSTRPGKIEGHLMIGLNNREFGANAFYTPRYINQYEEVSTGLAAFQLAMKRAVSDWRFNAYFKFNKDHFLLDRFDPSFYQNDHMTSVSGSDLEGRISSAAGISHTGLHFRREQILSTSLGEPLPEGASSPGRDGIVFTHGHARNLVNLNINQTLERRFITFSGGLVMHMISDSGFRPFFSPGLDIRLNLPGKTRFYSSINRSMRLPTFTDLYYRGPSNVGNPELAPETAATFELGFYRDGELRAAINCFYRQGKDLIDWIWMEDEKWHTMNINRIDATGLDLKLQHKPSSLTWGPVYLGQWMASYSFTHLAKVSDHLISRYVLDNLRHKAVLSTDFVIANILTLAARISYQDRNGSYLKYDHETGLSVEHPFDPYLLFDIRATCSVKKFGLFLEATNLFNVEYNDIGNVIQPGRWIIAGFEIR